MGCLRSATMARRHDGNLERSLLGARGGSDDSEASSYHSQLGTNNMLANQPTWTPERIEPLKNRFDAGLSCREIACDIGVSRNAVIGTLSRLHLTREKSDDARRPPRKDAAAKGQRGSAVPRLQYQMLRALYAEPEPAAAGEPIHNGQTC